MTYVTLRAFVVCYSLSVQRHGQRSLSIKSFCGGYRCLFPGQHNAQKGWPDKKGQRQALVGQIQVLQDWHEKWGILLPPFQSEQVFPICVIWRRHGHKGFIFLLVSTRVHLCLLERGGGRLLLQHQFSSFMRNEVWRSLEQQLLV